MKLIRAAKVLTGRSGETVAFGEVLVDGTRIVAVRPTGSTPPDPDTEIIDLPTATVLPGLIDSHVHLGFDNTVDPDTGRSAETDAHLVLRMAENARKLLSAGVTTARDLGGRSFLDVALRDAIEEGIAVGPRLVVATRPITSKGGHCWYMGGQAEDEAAVRRVARENLAAGADCLKVMASGGQMTPGAPASWQAQFDTQRIRAVVEEAALQGKTVAAHAHAPRSIESALEAGVTTIEHCTFLTETGVGYDPRLVDRIAEAGTYVCPTVHGLFWKMRDLLGAERMDPWLERVFALRQAGVRLIAGTDCGFGLLGLECRADEFVTGLEVFAHGGFPAAEIIEMATVRAADACGVGTETGSLEPGKRADLIAVDGDPLTDLSRLRDLSLVMVAGRAVTQSGVDTVASSGGGLG